MKKMFLMIVIICCICSYTKVNAKNNVYGSSTYYTELREGYIASNGYYLYTWGWSTPKEKTITIKYYDNEENLLKTDVRDNEIDQAKGYISEGGQINYQGYIYKVECDYSQLWIIKSITNVENEYQAELIPYQLEEEVDIYQLYLTGLGYDEEFPNYIVNDGDIVLWFVPRNYALPRIYFDDGEIHVSEFSNNNLIKIGYEGKDFANKINDNYEKYFYSFSGTSGGCGINILGYTQPKIAIECDKTVVTDLNKIICKFQVKSKYQMDQFEIDYSNIKLSISNIESNSQYVLTKKNNTLEFNRLQGEYEEYYYFNNDSEEISTTLFTFQLSNSNNIKEKELLNEFKINYKVGGAELTDKASFNTVIEKTKIDNPNTFNILKKIFISIIMIFISLGTLYFLRKKGLLSKV